LGADRNNVVARKILDSTRAVVEGASVTLANQTQGLSRRAATPSTGEFEFLALPPGTYVLTVEKAGFKKYEQTNLQLLVNVPNGVNVVLQVGASTTQIVVSGEAPVPLLATISRPCLPMERRAGVSSACT